MWNDYIGFASHKIDGFLTRELAAGSGASAWNTLFKTLPNPDPVLRKTGQSLSILDEIRRENHVASCSESRETAVTKKRWAIERNDASAQAAETVNAIFKNLPVRNIAREFCEAWGYGYQISEVIWLRQGDLLVPDRVLGAPRPWFTFGTSDAGALRRLLSTSGLDSVPAEPHKFLLTQHRASRDNPYGESKYSSCFWPVTFKKGGLKFWAMFLEKFGMPHYVGKVARGNQQAEREELLNALRGLIQDACAVIPDDGSVEIHNPAISGSSDAYERFTAYHDGEISTAILGHSAAATSTPGRLGGDDLALMVRADIAENDCAMVATTFNTLIQWILELNPSLGSERPAFVLYENKEVDKILAERDALLLNTNRVKFSKKYFMDKYGFADDEIEVVEPAAQTAAEFAAPRRAPRQTASASQYQAAVSELSDGIDGLIDDATATAQHNALLNPVLSLVNNASTFADVSAGLNDIYNNIDTAAVEQTAEKVTLLGETWGRLGCKAKEAGNG